MNDVEISVLMPAYNAEKYIYQAIDSCINQSFSNFEVIVIDDGSTDDTRNIVTNIRDDRIKLTTLKNNSGPAIARNTALSLARGKWITVLDSDDVWHPQRLSMFYNIANRLGEKSVLFDEIQEVFEARSGKLRKHKITNFGACRGRSRKEFVEITVEKLIRLSLGEKPFFSRNLAVTNKITYPEGIHFGEDFCFLVRLLNLQDVVLYQICQPLYYSRIRQGSLTASPEKYNYKSKVYELMLNEKCLTAGIRKAILYRKGELWKEKHYLKFKTLIDCHDWPAMFGFLLKNPNVLWRFIKGLPVSLSYRLRAYLYGSKIR